VTVKPTTVPLEKLALHVEPQEIPEGLLVTVPDPVPALVTDNVNEEVPELKVAVTDVAALNVMLQVPVPVHAPPHPAKLEPEPGFAVRVTTVPL
jgi:hypothetical protein